MFNNIRKVVKTCIECMYSLYLKRFSSCEIHLFRKGYWQLPCLKQQDDGVSSARTVSATVIRFPLRMTISPLMEDILPGGREMCYICSNMSAGGWFCGLESQYLKFC